MKYTQKSFNGPTVTPAYRDNFDRIFRQCTSEFELDGVRHRCEKEKKVQHEMHVAPLPGGRYIEWK